MLMEQVQPKHPIRPTVLASAMGWSVPYASQVLNDRRPPSVSTALAVLDATGVQIGPLKGATADEIAFARKLAEAA